MDGVNSDLRWRICGRSGWNTNRKLLFKFPPPPGCCWDQRTKAERICWAWIFSSLRNIAWLFFFLVWIYFVAPEITRLSRYSWLCGVQSRCFAITIFFGLVSSGPLRISRTSSKIGSKELKREWDERIKKVIRLLRGSADKPAVVCLNAACHPWCKNAK